MWQLCLLLQRYQLIILKILENDRSHSDFGSQEWVGITNLAASHLECKVFRERTSFSFIFLAVKLVIMSMLFLDTRKVLTGIAH